MCLFKKLSVFDYKIPNIFILMRHDDVLRSFWTTQHVSLCMTNAEAARVDFSASFDFSFLDFCCSHTITFASLDPYEELVCLSCWDIIPCKLKETGRRDEVTLGTKCLFIIFRGCSLCMHVWSHWQWGELQLFCMAGVVQAVAGYCYCLVFSCFCGSVCDAVDICSCHSLILQSVNDSCVTNTGAQKLISFL